MTRSERWVPYLFLAPALALLIVFRFLPALASFRESLYMSSFTATGGQTFVGLENFVFVLGDPVFWKSLWVTLLFSLVINPLQTVLALGLGVLANQRVGGIVFFRSTYLLPVAVSINVTALVWGLMLDKNAGLVNGLLAYIGIPRQPFLISESHALWSIIWVATWKGAPFWMIFFLAGLQGIPQSLLEAAAIDGATAWQSFTQVTLPLLRRVIVFVLVADTIINFILFVPVFLLTKGGPQLSTHLIMFDVYRRAFVYGDYGSAAAMTSILLVIVIAVVMLEFSLLRAETR
jgi:ABC-type sugar transport system permease subunit